MRYLRLAAVALLGAVACARTSPPAISFAPGPQPGPFSPAVRVGDMLYLSGQIGTDSTGQLVAGGIQPETRQALENIRRVLAQNGSSMDRVVKCTAFLADMAEWGKMNEVYASFFPNHKPARSAMGANGLARNARVEIECIAVVGAS